MKTLFSRFLALLLAVPIVLFVWVVYTLVFADDHQAGSRVNLASSSLADDCPISLPQDATNISYAYDLHWQGGSYLVLYQLPERDLKDAANSFLKQHQRSDKPSPGWHVIDPSNPSPSAMQHRFAEATWFAPEHIQNGWVTDSSGILWSPRVWIDTDNRQLYILNQN